MHRSILSLAAAMAFPVLATHAIAAPNPSPSSGAWRSAMSPAELARDTRLVARVDAAYDTARGGYVAKGGVLSESAVRLALANGQAGPDAESIARARRTLDWMRALEDSTGGGTYDRGPGSDGQTDLVDKSTVVQAERLELMIDAWRVTGDRAYRERARRLVEFSEQVLIDPRGGFVVSQVGDRELLPEPNGRMIHAWLEWACVTGDPKLRDFALQSLDRTWTADWVDGAGLVRRGVFGVSRPVPMLIDQAEMGRAFVLAARVGGRAVDRERAVKLGELLLARFEDPAKGGFRTQTVIAKDGSVKKSSRDDDANARAVWFLMELGRLTQDPRDHAAAERALAAFDDRFDKAALEAADWALAARAAFVDDPPAAPAWRAVAAETPYQPARSHTYRTGRR